MASDLSMHVSLGWIWELHAISKSGPLASTDGAKYEVPPRAPPGCEGNVLGRPFGKAWGLPRRTYISIPGDWILVGPLVSTYISMASVVDHFVVIFGENLTSIIHRILCNC